MAGLLDGQPEYGNQLGSQPVASNLFDKRAGLLNRTASGQPLTPQEIAASDLDTATVLDEARKGLRRFGFSTIATTQGFAGAMIEPFAPQAGRGLVQSGLRTMEEMPHELRPAVENWADVHDARSGALKFGSSVGEGLPSSALAVAAGLGGRAVGAGMAMRAGLRGTAADAMAARYGFGAGMASMVPAEGGETALDLAGDPVAMANTSAMQRAGMVLGRGGVNAALENIVPQALVVPHLLGKAARIAPGVGAGLRNIGLLAAEGALGEYGTEAAQELTGQATQRLANPNAPWDLRKAHEAGLSGAATGLFLGGAGGGAQAFHSNVGAGIDKAKELFDAGAEKVKGVSLPTFDDLVGHVRTYAKDPAALGADLARGTVEGVAKAAEAAGVLREHGLKGIDTAEAYLSKTYDDLTTFIGKNIKDPENKRFFADQAAQLKTMTLPEWQVFKKTLNEASTGGEFVEGATTTAALLGRKTAERAGRGWNWLKDATKSYVSEITKAVEGKQAQVSMPDSADRHGAMEQLYAVAPALREKVKAMGLPISAQRDLADLMHFAINDAQFLQRGENIPEVAAALKEWHDGTGTDLVKILDAVRTGRNDITLRELAADPVAKVLKQSGINPELHDSLVDMVKDTSDYTKLSETQKRLLQHVSGGSEAGAQATFEALSSAAERGQYRAERESGAGAVNTMQQGLERALQPAETTGAAPGSDEAGAGVSFTPEGQVNEAAPEPRSPFNDESFKRILTVRKYRDRSSSRLPVTMQATNADVGPAQLANLFGDRVGNEEWAPHKKGALTWTKADGLRMSINPMSLANVVTDERFRSDFEPHMVALDQRPGASFDEIKGERFMNVLTTLADQGIHVDPEKLGLPADHPLVHIKVNVDLSKLADDLIISQDKGGKNKLTWGDIAGDKRLQLTMRKQQERLKEFKGKFEGANAALFDSKTDLDSRIAKVVYARAAGALKEAGETRKPTPKELDAATEAYYRALPELRREQKLRERMQDYAADARNAYSAGDISEEQMLDLVAYFAGDEGINFGKVMETSAVFHQQAFNRKKYKTEKLSEQLRQDMDDVDRARQGVESTMYGKGEEGSLRGTIIRDWLEFRYSAAQKAQQERTRAQTRERSRKGAAKDTSEAQPTADTPVEAVPLGMTGAEWAAEKARRAEVQAEKVARAAAEAEEAKNLATAPPVPAPKPKRAKKAAPAPAPAPAPASSGVAQKVVNQLQRLLDVYTKTVNTVIDSLPDGVTKTDLAAAFKAQHDKHVEALKDALTAAENALAQGKTPSDLVKVWETHLKAVYEPLLAKAKEAAKPEREVGMSAERATEIVNSKPAKEVTFLNGQTYAHGILNRLVQDWTTKYLPNTKISLHIFEQKPGDARGFVTRRNPNTIYLRNEFENHLTVLSTLAHEFGHLLQYNAFDKAVPEVQAKIKEAYEADLRALRTGRLTVEQALQRFGSAGRAYQQRNELGEQSKLSAKASEQTGPVREEAESKYIASFPEWFANQFSRYVTQGIDKGLTPAEKSFWQNLIKELQDFFEAVVKRLTPNAEFESWVQGLATPEPSTGEPDIPFSMGGDMPPPPPPPPGGPPNDKGPKIPNKRAKKEFLKIVHSMMGDKKVKVLFDQKLEEGVKGTFETRAEKLQRIHNQRRGLTDDLTGARGDKNDKQAAEVTAKIKALDQEESAIMADTAVQGFIYLATGMEKKAGLAEHETFHAAFHIFFDANEKRILGTAFSRGLAGKRLREIFKDDAIVLKRIEESSEEAAAYAFQIWAADPTQFQLGAQVETMFQKLLNFIRKLFGVPTNDEKAQMIMNHLKSGQRYAQAISPVARKLDKDLAWQERAQNMAQDIGGLLKQGFDILLGPTYERMLSTNNPAIAKIAELGYQATGEEGNTGGMVQRGRFEYKRQINKLGAIFKDLSEDELKVLHEAMVFDRKPDDAKVAARVAQLQQWYKDMYKYQTQAGVLLKDAGIKQNYYPLTWDPEKVLKNKKAFLDMLEKHYANEFLTAKKTPLEVYESITGYIDRGEDLVNVMGANKEPLSESTKTRTLAFIKREHRLPFMQDDPVHTAFRYTKQAVRQAEYVRSYGMKSAKLEALKKEALDKYKATPEEIALTNDYIDGLMGNKEVGMSRELKDLYGAMAVYQNYRLLPFSLFSSLVDPMGIAIRSNSAMDAWETFTYSMKNLFKEWKKEYTRDFWEQLAEDWGVVEHSGTTMSATNLYDGITLRGTTKDLNDKLFKYNLLNGWVRNNTIMAVKMAQKFIYRASEGQAGKGSERYLAELGLTKDDVVFDAAQQRLLVYADELEAAGMSKKDAAATEAKLRNAVDKFVRQALLNPSAAELPNWASNPYLLPIAHLKQFVFAFNATIVDRIIHELKHNNFKPIGLAAAYVPSMIAADFIKDMIAGFGEEPPYKKNWGVYDYFNNGLDRSGLMGTGQFFSSASEDVVRGGGGWESFVGPTAQQARQAVKAFSSGSSEQIENWMIKAMPLQPLYKQHLISPGGEAVKAAA